MRVAGMVLVVLGGVTLGFQGWAYGMAARPAWVEAIWKALSLSDRPWLLPIVGGALVTAGLMLLARSLDWNGSGSRPPHSPGEE